MKKVPYPVFLVVYALLTGCSYPHYFYSPNAQNVPLFSESNILAGNVAGSLGIVNNSLEIQGAYSLPAGIALTANFMTGGNDNSSESLKDNSKNSYFEGAVGYYKPIQSIGVFEIYGGYGTGSQQHTFTYVIYNDPWEWITVPDGSASLKFSKVFVQPDVGIKIKWFEAAVSCRISVLNFNKIENNGSEYHSGDLMLLEQFNPPWLLEPAVTIRAGAKSVKAQIQIVTAKNLTNSDMKFEDLRYNFGLTFRFSTKQRDNTTP